MPDAMPDNPKDAGLTLLHIIPIPFKIISKSNEKTAGRYLSAKYRTFEESVAYLAKATCGELMLKEGWAVIRPAFQNKVHSDLGNLSKGLLDGLKKGRVLHDDKYIACTVVPAVYGHTNGEIELWGKK